MPPRRRVTAAEARSLMKDLLDAVKTSLLVAVGRSPKRRPSQSPAAGAASSDVKTMGFAGVPTATSDARAGVVLEATATRKMPPFLKRIVTPASIVSVTLGLPTT